MKRIVPICRPLFDRAVASVFLIVLAPTIALVALLLRTNTDEPILVTEDLATGGMHLHTYRFRTTGRGTPGFRLLGRLLRSGCIDVYPGLWAVVCGQISLAQFFRLGRRK